MWTVLNNTEAMLKVKPQERLLRMNYVPIDSNRSLVRIRTGFFVLFSVFKKRMTLGKKAWLRPGGALRPIYSCEQGDSLSYRDCAL